MVNVSIDVTDLGGEARPGDKVVFWRPRMGGSATHAGRVISTAPVTVFLTDGKATVSDVEPGEMTVLLQCRGVESQGPVTVGVPDGNGTVTLRALLESQFEYAPPIVSAVQEAASNASASEEAAIQAQIRSEAAADRADAKVDDAINNGANLVRNEVKQDADRAVSARQAAAQSESNAAASESAAASSASNAAASESAAKQSEANAGDYAAVATTAATEAVDAMETASDAVSTIGDSVSEAAGHATRASQSESGAAAYAQNASDAADRVGTAEQVGTWAQQAQDAADRIGTAETVEGWANSARDSASAAGQAETKAKEYRDAAFSAANSTSDSIRSDLASIATDASRSASRAKTSETNAATHEANSLSAAERAEFAAEETIQQVEGDFATRNYVDTQTWDRGVVGASIENLDQLSLGSWGVASTSVANKLGLPGTLGNVTIDRIASGKSVLYRTMESGLQKHSVWITSISRGVIAPWKRIDNDGDSTGAPGLKTVGVTLTAGSALDGTPGRCRVLAQVKAPVTRWRVHIESRRQVFSSTADFTLGAVLVGKHSGNGNITGTTSLKSGDTSISGSSEWVSRWVTDDLSEETLIDFSVSGTGLYSYQAGAYRLNGSTWEPATNVPAAVWIEVETYAETPVVAMIGDSTGAGQGADRPVHDSALHVASRKHGFIPMNYSYPGSTMKSMANPEHHIYKRWAHLSQPDSVIIQSGSNDIHGGTATSELQTRFENLAKLARGISPVVFGATVKARYPSSGDFSAALTSHNAYVKTQPAGARDYLDFYQAVSPNGTVASVDAADGAHLSTSGHAKLASAFDLVQVARPPAVSAVDVAVKADKSYVDQRVPVEMFSGIGSPEGKVLAPVGSIYTDTAATNGAIRWIKSSGEGSTGWKVEYGDTGWRDITSLITSSPALIMGTGAKIAIRRTSGSVFFRVIGPATMAGTFGNIVAAQPGLRPDLDTNSPAAKGASFRNTRSWIRLEDGTRDAVLVESGRAVETMWSTTEAWPATLPGTPL